MMALDMIISYLKQKVVLTFYFYTFSVMPTTGNISFLSSYYTYRSLKEALF
jgi:hypothetical protein